MRENRDKVAYHASNVYRISPSFFATLGIKALLCDLDNTLDEYDCDAPSPEAFALKKMLSAMGIELLVISNNGGNHVRDYCQRLGVSYLPTAFKLTAFKTRRFLKKLGLSISDCLFIGDQIFTDRIYVKKLKGRLVLTDPLSSRDHFLTRLVRRFDLYLRRRWLKEGRLGKAVPEKEE